MNEEGKARIATIFMSIIRILFKKSIQVMAVNALLTPNDSRGSRGPLSPRQLSVVVTVNLYSFDYFSVAEYQIGTPCSFRVLMHIFWYPG